MQLKPTIRKQPADSVPYGTDIAQHGRWVYVAYDGARRVCVGATAKEARKQYYRVRLGSAYGNPPTQLPLELEGRRDSPRRLSDDLGYRGRVKS